MTDTIWNIANADLTLLFLLAELKIVFEPHPKKTDPACVICAPNVMRAALVADAFP